MKKTRRILTMLVAASAVAALVLQPSGPSPTGAGFRASVVVGLVGLILLAARIAFTTVDVKSGSTPPMRLVLPLLILIQGMVAVLGTDRLGGATVIGVAALEAALVLAVVVSLLRGRQAPGLLLEDRIAGSLTALVPARLARLVAMELVILSAVVRAPFRAWRETASGLTFSYSETTRLRLLISAGPLLLLFEGIFIHRLLGPDHLWLRILHAAVCVYATLWIWGAYALMKLRPHRIDGEELWVHRGVWGHLRVPVADVASVRAVSDDSAGSTSARSAEAVAFTIKGPERVELTFRTAVAPMGFLQPLRQTQRIVVSPDDPGAFCSAVARAANLTRV